MSCFIFVTEPIFFFYYMSTHCPPLAIFVAYDFDEMMTLLRLRADVTLALLTFVCSIPPDPLTSARSSLLLPLAPHRAPSGMTLLLFLRRRVSEFIRIRHALLLIGCRKNSPDRLLFPLNLSLAPRPTRRLPPLRNPIFPL